MKTLTTGKISFQNLKRKPFRTIALMVVAGILAFVLFSGTILTLSLKNGLKSVEARFGADLIVVPLGYEGAQEAILLTGEPSYFYFDRTVEDKLSQVEGIEMLTTQFYLTSLGADCCDLPVQIIGYDPSSDFVIQPWICQRLSGGVEDGKLIVGSDIHLDNDLSVKFYDKVFPVAAQLDETGTGLDQSVFATQATIKDLFTHAKKKGMNFLSDTNPDTLISSVLIKAKDGYTVEQIMTNIRRKVDGVQIIKTQSMIAKLSQSLDKFTGFLYFFAAIALVMAPVLLSVVFSTSANERKKEFATLRILGATRKKLASILIRESLYIGGTGGTLGILLAAMFVFPFSLLISQSIGLPYIQPAPLLILAILLGTLLISLLIGPLASAYAAVKISRVDTYLAFREGE